MKRVPRLRFPYVDFHSLEVKTTIEIAVGALLMAILHRWICD